MRSLSAFPLLALLLVSPVHDAARAEQGAGSGQLVAAASDAARAGAERLGALLPPALEGWSRTIDPAALSSAAMFGIVSAKASYWATAADDPRDEITRLMERVPFVAVTLWANPTPELLAQMEAQRRMAEENGLGTVEEIGGERFLVTPLGDLQALVGGRVALTVSGMASAEEKRAHLDRIDIAALRDFRP